MLTLNQATIKTRVALKWSGIFFLVLIMIFFIFKIGAALKQTIFPTQPAPPTVSYKKLPSIVFPNNLNENSYNYSLNTVSGTLPIFQDRISVYKMVPIPPDLLALNKATNKVISVGFTNPEVPISTKVFRWDSDEPLSKSLTMDILSTDFVLSSTFISNNIVLSAANLSNQTAAINTAQDFLSSMYSFPNDIDIYKTKTYLFSIDNNTLITATSVSNAQVIEVDFFQKDINKLPIYYPKAVNSTINVLVVGGENESQVAQVNYSHQTVSNESATYPIKTAEDAYSLLQQGKGYIASYFGSSTDISIKNVFLAYYIGDKKQDYLFPIAVFEGDNGFFAYVPIITDEWISN